MGKWKNSDYSRSAPRLQGSGVSIASGDVERAMRLFRTLGKNVGNARQKVLAAAAKPMLAAAKSAAPVSKKPHKRYANSTLAATYYPGNLRRSLQVLKFRRKKSAVFLGAKLSQVSTGIFKGRRADGYYMHMVEFGTSHSAAKPFWMPAYNANKAQVEQNIKDEFRKIIEQTI